MANLEEKKSYKVFRELLEEKNITPYRVAKDLGFSPMALSDWKHSRSKPKLDKMLKIADYLDVPVGVFDCDDSQDPAK